MARIVRHDLGLDRGEFDEGLWAHARAILAAAKVQSHDDAGAVAAIHAYVRDKIFYVRDPTGGMEDIADPRIPIANGFGDCDDLAVTESVLLGMVGFPTRFVVVRLDPKTQDGFDHVYLEVSLNDRWIALDPTNNLSAVGWEVPHALERKVFSIFGAHGADHDLEGFKSTFKKIGKVALKVAPIALSVVPVPGAGIAARAANAGINAGINATRGYVDSRSGGGGKTPKMNDASIAAQGQQFIEALNAGGDPDQVWAAALPILNAPGGGSQTIAVSQQLSAAVNAARAVKAAKLNAAGSGDSPSRGTNASRVAASFTGTGEIGGFSPVLLGAGVIAAALVLSSLASN
jgi:hypothetical protein